MATGSSSSFLIPYLRNDPVCNIEALPQTDSNDGMLLQNGHHPDVNHAEPYHGLSYNYGHWPQCCDNTSYQRPPPPPVASVDLDRQYAFSGNQNIDYSQPRNDQNNACGPYPPPPAHDIPNDGVRDRAPLMADVANPCSQSVPDCPPSETLAMESLKRLADRYLHDPGSRIETLRMGLSPTGGRLRVMIVFDMDV